MGLKKWARRKTRNAKRKVKKTTSSALKVSKRVTKRTKRKLVNTTRTIKRVKQRTERKIINSTRKVKKKLGFKQKPPKVITKPPRVNISVDYNWIETVTKTFEDVGTQAEYKTYTFYPFYHSQVCTMIKQLNRYGTHALLSPPADSEGAEALILQKGSTNFSFKEEYKPQSIVETNYPTEGFDFDIESPYGLYNWEIFFHIPIMMATKLSQNQKFEDAQRWFHYVFNPTEVIVEGATTNDYWKFKPFHEYEGENSVNELLSTLGNGEQDEALDTAETDGSEAFMRQLNNWLKTPFAPHAIARVRTVAYMKSVTMKYIDNLIAWGDHLFRRDTLESINEATQLYILADEILGDRPVIVKKKSTTARTIEDVLDEIENGTDRLSEIESEVGRVDNGSIGDIGEGLNSLSSILSFCTAPNEKLFTYWDTVTDRLFKIRNCQNIDGVTRSLALFEPPIDPALLVKAAAAGIDIGTVLNNISGTSLPNYRFRVLIQKALDLCNDVKSLGGALLSALEKKDAEEIALLRANQEVALLKAVQYAKQQSVKEAEENIASLELTKALAETRSTYYSSREYMNVHEKEQIDRMDKAQEYQLGSQISSGLASILAAIPDLQVGISGTTGSPYSTISVGGSTAYNVLQGASAVLSALGGIESHKATKAGLKGGYDRRRDDWELQADLADIEIQQIEKQITTAQIRLAISEKDLSNHELQITQSTEISEVMQDKFTNKDLYGWMTTQISSLYFQSYQLAFDVARTAEQAYGYELGVENTSFIQYGHWDSLRKGLLVGERLQADLRRMEVAYLEQNKREYELTKHISLSQLSPAQLIDLRETGVCDVYIPEVLFDLDHPGHYMRRIKSMSLTIPCVTGPYTNVSATLTLLSNRTRKTSNAQGEYSYQGIEDSTRFSHDVAGIQSIATSGAQNDSGMFELNFNDHRYLPFEGAGVISTWRLELSSQFRQFNYDTISDVILHMNYTAREGGALLRDAANASLAVDLNKVADQFVEEETGMENVFSLKTHFPNTLYALLQQGSTAGTQEASFAITRNHFPYFVFDRELSVLSSIKVNVKFKQTSQYSELENRSDITSIELDLVSNEVSSSPDNLQYLSNDINLALSSFDSATGVSPIDTWTIRAMDSDIADKFNTTEVEDIYIIINYKILPDG